MSGELIAWYEKDGNRQGAYSPTDAVNLVNRGFRKVVDVDPETLSETPVEDDEQAEDEVGGSEATVTETHAPSAPIPPPLVGTGSGTDEWRAYAKAVDVDVTDLEKRGEIVDALRDAGKPVEPTDPQ